MIDVVAWGLTVQERERNREKWERIDVVAWGLTVQEREKQRKMRAWHKCGDHVGRRRARWRRGLGERGGWGSGGLEKWNDISSSRKRKSGYSVFFNQFVFSFSVHFFFIALCPTGFWVTLRSGTGVDFYKICLFYGKCCVRRNSDYCWKNLSKKKDYCWKNKMYEFG